MKVSSNFTQWLALVFAAVCIAYGVKAWIAASDLVEGAVRGDARSFAWLWLLLGGIGLVSTLASWLMARGRRGAPES